MIRTKHLAVIVALALGVLIGFFFALLLIEKDARQTARNDTSPVFAPGGEKFGSFVSEDTRREDARKALISKLGEYERDEDKGFVDETVESDLEDSSEWPSGALPLGDGEITTSPQVGTIFSCQQSFGGGGAHAAGDWISDGYWYPDEKATVDGSVSWPNNVTISKAEGARLVRANGLPDHTTGVYPISASDDAYQYDRNPNSIAEQSVLLQLPRNPSVANAPRCLPLGAIGVGLNGVAIFNGLDGQGLDAPAHEIQDSCNGHPEQTGEYHYHNESECLVNAFYEGAASTLLGYALDGFGIFSSLENGATLTSEELDMCHGHTHTIPWDGENTLMYHYHMTKEYPYTLGCFVGDPVEVTGAGDLPPLPPGDANSSKPGGPPPQL